MAQQSNENGNNNNKSMQNFSGMKLVGIVLIIVILVAASIYAIFEGIISRITSVIFSPFSIDPNRINEIGRRALNFVAFWQYTPPGGDTLFFYQMDDSDINGVDDTDMENNGIRTYLKDQAIEMDKIGLDSLMLKKIELVFNATRATKSSVILAELAGEEKDENDNVIENEILKVTNPEQYAADFELGEDEKNALIKLYSEKRAIRDDRIRIYNTLYNR